MSSGAEQTKLDALRLARLIRYAQGAELSEATRNELRTLLIEALLDEPARELGAPVCQPEPERQPEPGPAPRAEAAADKRPAAQRLVPRRPEQIELRIRQLVEADARWPELEAEAFDLYSVRPKPETAARIVELAFLHGDNDTVQKALERFAALNEPFYRQIHDAVRAHITARLWREGGSSILSRILFKDRDEAYLQPIERLYVFQSMCGARDKTAPYMYFRRYRKPLVDAAYELGPHVDLNPARILLAAGQMAIDLGYDDEAREILAQIKTIDEEHDEALRLLLDVRVEKNKAGRSHYLELIMAEGDWASRLALLGRFLDATRGLGGFRDRNRPALNELLKSPVDWLGEDAEAYSGLSVMLMANRDLESLLPNLFDVFKTNATRFLHPNLDAALWRGPLNLKPERARDRYWHGVAQLHHFIQAGVAAEASLWAARDLIAAAKKTWRLPLPYEWRELHKAALQWVAKSHYLLEVDRQRMLQQLRVAVDQDSLAVSDLEEYLTHADMPLPGVLDALQKVTAGKNAPALEVKLVLKRAAALHLTNDDLNRMWQLANQRNESDLAWRVASVIHARQALTAQVRHAWEISGEKRSQYGFVVPPKQAIEKCLRDYPEKVARLAFACLHVGPVLPELLALLDPGAAMARPQAPAPDSVEAQVDQALVGINWLGVPKKRFRFSFESAVGGSSLPAFMHVLPANVWSVLAARIAERLGINAWGWRLSRLNSQIVDLIPRLASKQDLRRSSGRVAKWLKELTPEQRAAWQDMAALSRSLTDEQAVEGLAGFVCRLATLICQNHHLALTSLQAMRAPVAVIWDLERWLLSDHYTDVRKKLGTVNRVLVPNALQRLASVIEAPASLGGAGT